MHVLGRLSLGVTALALMQTPVFAQYKVESRIDKSKTPSVMPVGMEADDKAAPATPAPKPAPLSTIVSPAHMDGGPGCCAPSCGNACCEEEPGMFGCGRIAIFGDYIWMTVRGTDLVFAQSVDGCTSLAVPRGAVGQANPDYSPGFRIGAGYALSPCNSVRASYTWWDSSTTDTLTGANGLFIRSLLTFPTTESCATTANGAASARFDHDLRIADIEFKHIITQSCNSHLGVIAGVRYAHLDQDLRSDVSVLGTTTVTTGINFDGVGPRLGVAGEFYSKGGVFGYGLGAVSFLVGHFGNSFRQENNFVGVQAESSFGDDRIVPVFDLELGVGWQSQGGGIVVRVGYLIEAWCNTVTTRDLVDSIRGNNFTTNGGNLRDWLTFDGVTARVEFRF